jgi:hypothetical protein
MKKNNLNQSETPLKILVCSPSNGGCDELARRLKRDIDNNLIQIQNREYGIVRIGRTESIHRDCDSISFDHLVRKKFETQNLIGLENCSNSVQAHFESIITKEKNLKMKLELAKNGGNREVIKECEEKLHELARSKRQYEGILQKKVRFPI